MVDAAPETALVSVFLIASKPPAALPSAPPTVSAAFVNVLSLLLFWSSGEFAMVTPYRVRAVGSILAPNASAWSAFDDVATRGYIVCVKTVGVRDLKNRLSEYLRMVRSGESVLITDRGEVIAELNAPGRGGTEAGVPPGLQSLARRGLVRLGGPNDKAAYKRLTRALQKGSSRVLLDQERGEK